MQRLKILKTIRVHLHVRFERALFHCVIAQPTLASENALEYNIYGDTSILKERANIHCYGIAFPRSFYLSSTSTEATKLKCFKCTANNIFILGKSRKLNM